MIYQGPLRVQRMRVVGEIDADGEAEAVELVAAQNEAARRLHAWSPDSPRGGRGFAR